MKYEELEDGLDLYVFEWNFITSKMYMLIRDNNALVIDPVYTEEMINHMKSKKIENILVILTHEHFDHISGVNWLRKQEKVMVIANQNCAKNIRSAQKNLSNHTEVLTMFNKELNPEKIKITPFTCIADITFDEKMNFVWKDYNIQLTTTPGHSEGSICILVDYKYLFTGDTLLYYPTITRMPGGSRIKFQEQTIPYLFSMYKYNYRVFPGHGESGYLQTMLQKYKEI